MTQRQWYYSNYVCTIPAGTHVTAPVTIPIPTGDIWLEQVRYYIPSGSSGLMGWYLAQNNVPILPWTGNLAYIIEQNTTDVLDVGDEVQGLLALVGYNTGMFNHVVRLRLKYFPAVLIVNGAENAIVIPAEQLSAPATEDNSPPPSDGITPNSDGSCPIGYVIDPAGSGYCVPAAPPPMGSIAPNPDGSCPVNYQLDPAGSGYCIPYVAPDLGGIAPNADGTCPAGYVQAEDGSGLCIPIGDLASTQASS